MLLYNVQEQVTTTDTNPPQQVVTKTIQQVEPAAKGEAPQKVYEKKKTIFRSSQIIWYVVGLLEVLLGFRLIFKILAANETSGFVNMIYAITDKLILPFRQIFQEGVSGNSVLEPSTIVAMIVYAIFAWGLVYLLDLINPITPERVEAEGV